MGKILKSTEIHFPGLWVRRLVLFESPERKDSPFRDIQFQRGINIIWGIELSDDAGTDDAHPVTLAGHSVGKTTLCRLIRYCLGETTYGNPAAMERIRSTFPQGWVGLDVAIESQNWSILRPFNSSKHSKAAHDHQVSELFDVSPTEYSFRAFTEELQRQFIGSLPVSGPPGSAKPYEWKHLLSWLARDQEARFQSLHEWRSKRSGADTPHFEKPKEDPLHLIRIVLGLVGEEENHLATTIVQAENELKEVQTRIAEVQREPAQLLASQERQIRAVLRLGAGANLDESDLTSPILSSRGQLVQDIQKLDSEIKDIDEAIADSRYWLAWHSNEQMLEKDAIRITAEGMEPPRRRNSENETIKQLREMSGRDCTYGNIPFDDCDYVKKHRDDLRQIRDLQQVREGRRVDSVTAERLGTLRQLETKHKKTLSLLQDVARDLRNNVAKRKELDQELSKSQFDLYALNELLSQRRQTQDLIEGRVANSQLGEMNQRAEELAAGIERDKQELQRVQEAQAERVKDVSKAYDRLVKGALSNTYIGQLRMSKGEFEFEIAEATGLSGEAVETLALVLADLTAVMCSCDSIGYHPRFLMHDSPREADLDRHIYNRYLQMMQALSTERGGPSAAPFQYIVTTTTAPPDSLTPSIAARLQGHPESEMLFGRLLRPTVLTTPKSLFDEPLT